jgi:hypothetical protein
MPFHAYSRIELILTERKRLERPLMAMIWLSILIFSLVQWDFFYLLAATLAVGVNAYAAQRGKEVFVHRVFVNLGVLVVTGILVLEVIAYGRDMLLFAMGHYFILILVCKLFEHKTNRDYVQMLVLSMMLTVVAAVMCDKLWFAVLLLMYVAIACYTAMVFTIKRGLDKAAQAVLDGEKVSPGPGVIAWNTIHHWPGRSLSQWMVAIMLMIAAGSAATFIAVPRIPASALGYQNNRSTSGFSDNVQLGEQTQIHLSKEVLMQVTFTCGTGGAPLPSCAFYLRGRVFEEYRGNAWVHGLPNGSSVPPVTPDGAGVIQDVTLYPAMGSATIFASYPAVSISSRSGTVEISSNMEATLRHAIPGEIVRYNAYSWTQPLTARQRQYLDRTEGVSTGHEPVERAPTGPTPVAHPRSAEPTAAPTAAAAAQRQQVVALAQEWCRDLLLARKNDQDHGYDQLIADRLAQRLGQRCTYSLDLSDANPDRDGVYDFLFHMEKGHCEYFASALTIMCRALGVRARLATGFHLDPAAGKENVYLVRGGDAHAWTEIYTPDTGWTIVDATPAGTARTHQNSFWNTIEMFFSDMEYQWYDKVVGFDSGARERLLKRIPKALDAIRGSIVNFFTYGNADAVFVLCLVVVGTGGLVVEAVCIHRLVRKTRRYQRQMRGAGLVSPAHVRFAKLLANLLNTLAPKRSPAATPREILQTAVVGRAYLPDNVRSELEVGRALPDNVRTELAELVELYYKIRWGKLIASRRQMQAAADKLRILRRSVVKH